MPLKLNVGASKKVGEPNYGSRGASVNVELELDTGLIAKPLELRERIRELFGVVRASLVEELNGHGGSHGAPADRQRVQNGNGHNGHADHDARVQPSGQGQPRGATQSQIKALFAIAKSRGLNLNEVIRDRFRCGTPEQLSIREASQLIDSLKSTN
ncbi:MAG TPA: hypothetical protein VGP68_05465 [Gemmataceae bacterium]|jgi:hypothetical protein|nr:hypothetical protein [Gemmataceae bacterium]